MSKPLSREFLLERGACCDNGCVNCPWRTTMHLFILTQPINFAWVGATWALVCAEDEVQALTLKPAEWHAFAPIEARRDRKATDAEVAKGPHLISWSR